MTVTPHEQSAPESLAAARLRGVEPDELLDLADAAIEQATAAGQAVTLELIAAQLDAAAAEQPEKGDGLRIAAARARAAAPVSPAPPSHPTPEPAEPVTDEVIGYASWGSRFVAWLIDWCILFAAATLISYAIGDTPGTVFGILGSFAYFAYLNGQGSTFGKRLLRMKVVDATTKAPIGTARGAARELVRVTLAFLTLGIGLILDGLRPLWNENHQTWHDAAAKSIVIRGSATRGGLEIHGSD
jgi:uncharacterized RDD family membrane protein YckC